MIVLVSLASLLGLLILPCAKHPRFKNYYQYLMGLLISLGASALFSDAILHLIPEVSGLGRDLSYTLLLLLLTQTIISDFCLFHT